MEENKKKEDDAKIVNNNTMTNCQVFLGNQYGCIFPTPGANVTIKQYLDPQKMKEEETKKAQETKEEEKKAEAPSVNREEVMKDIIRRFDFGNEHLAFDGNNRRITNDRLKRTFAQVFGLRGASPTEESLVIIELLWKLLLGPRDKCHKQNGEKFLRQTVLNILGYFHAKEVLYGGNKELAGCVFKKPTEADEKNVERALDSSCFTDEIKKHINIYIKKLKNGEI